MSYEENTPLLGEMKSINRPAGSRVVGKDEDIMALNTHVLGVSVPEHYYIPDWRRYLVGVEFAATFLFVFFGIGGSAESLLNNTNDGGFSSHVAWGLSCMFAVYVSASVSGGHLNPAITFALCLHKRFEWRFLPGYILAQLVGALLGGALIYGVYNDAINHYDDEFNATVFNGTATIFVGFPQPFVSTTNAIFDSLIGVSVFLFGIFAVLDPRNHISRGAQPGLLGLLLTIVILAFGYNCGAAHNPARDFGVRIFASAAYGSEIFTGGNYFFLIPMFVPFVGAAIGSSAYRLIVNPA